jgi:hypothetical protein
VPPEPNVDEPTDPPTLPPGVEESSVFTAATNDKCTFGFVASRTSKTTVGEYEYDGELTFHDHGKGMKFKSLCVDFVDFPVDEPTKAVFKGTGEVRTSAGTACVQFTVTVVDGGEPSTDDSFTIVLTECPMPDGTYPYSAWGPLGGGNIQLH